MKPNNILSKLDTPLIIIGIITLLAIISFPLSICLEVLIISVLGILGLCYITHTIVLLFFKRIDFDWKLMNGHFLRRIICIIVLLPFTFTLIIGTSIYAGKKTQLNTISSKKELIYEESLYAKNDSLPLDLRNKQDSPSLLWIVYSHFMDPGNQHMAASTPGRGWVAIIAISGVIFLNGILISILTNWFDKRREHWLRGEIRYPRFFLKKNKFAIVIGANEIVSSVIKNLLSHKTDGEINFKCEGNNEYVILQTCKEAVDVREELSSHLTEEDLKRVIIYNAQRDSKAELAELFIENATEIYILGESTLKDQGETYHDALNMKCVNMIADYLDHINNKNRTDKNEIHKKVCKVMFEYQTTYSMFQYSDMPENVNDNIVFIPFNCYETWAQRVMVEGVFDNREHKDCSGNNDETRTSNSGIRPDFIEYTPLDGKGISCDSDEYVHFVVVGMSKIGVAMGVQAMFQAHYLNFRKARSRITFIDTNADKEMAYFKGKYANLFSLTRNKYIDANNCPTTMLDPDLGWIDPTEQQYYQWAHLSQDGKNFIDLEIEFIKGEIESDGVRTYLQRITKNNKSKLTIAVCLTQTHQALAASLYMPVEIYKKVQEIWVYQREASDILTNLGSSEQKDKRYKKLRPFGMIYGEYMRDRSLYLKSLLTNGAYNIDNSFKKIDFGNKDTYTNLRMKWKELTIAKKWSNKFFVDTIYQKIRGVIPELFDCENVAGAYKLKLFGNTTIKDIEKRLRKALKDNEDILGQCEHNRWNVQQLLMEFCPCRKEDDELCCKLNNTYKEMYLLTTIYDKTPSTNYSEKKLTMDKAKSDFKLMKDELKESENRIHPNICEYSHLDDVDFEAKSFDINLNNAIPEIIFLVDGYGKIKLK